MCAVCVLCGVCALCGVCCVRGTCVSYVVYAHGVCVCGRAECVFSCPHTAIALASAPAGVRCGAQSRAHPAAPQLPRGAGEGSFCRSSRASAALRTNSAPSPATLRSASRSGPHCTSVRFCPRSALPSAPSASTALAGPSGGGACGGGTR